MCTWTASICDAIMCWHLSFFSLTCIFKVPLMLQYPISFRFVSFPTVITTNSTRLPIAFEDVANFHRPVLLEGKKLKKIAIWTVISVFGTTVQVTEIIPTLKLSTWYQVPVISKINAEIVTFSPHASILSFRDQTPRNKYHQ